MQRVGAIAGHARERWQALPLQTRSVTTRLLLIWLSFCAGLVVFYVPGRQYVVLPEVWLPHAAAQNRDATLAQPVKARFDQSYGVRFMPAYPDGPEIIEINTGKSGQKAAACPDLYDIDEVLPSKCKVAGRVDRQKVYVITRRLPSMNVNAYMMRGDTLIALSGVYSDESAVQFLKTFRKVARRDINSILSQNKQQVDTVSAAIKAEKQLDAKTKADAYKHLSFKPSLPAILPAGWVQHSMRITGDDAKHPTGAEVLYKKGSDHFITYTMKAAAGFTLGSTCGPTPGAGDAALPCGPVPREDYYAGGINGADYASWYTYRPVGDMIAILGTSVYNSQLLFSMDDLDAQVLIAKSLRPADVSKLKGAEFVGWTYDPYPFIKP